MLRIFLLTRESRAVDMESLCVLSGKLVWAVRGDLHILDNGGYTKNVALILLFSSTFKSLILFYKLISQESS